MAMFHGYNLASCASSYLKLFLWYCVTGWWHEQCCVHGQLWSSWSMYMWPSHNWCRGQQSWPGLWIIAKCWWSWELIFSCVLTVDGRGGVVEGQTIGHSMNRTRVQIRTELLICCMIYSDVKTRFSSQPAAVLSKLVIYQLSKCHYNQKVLLLLTYVTPCAYFILWWPPPLWFVYNFTFQDSNICKTCLSKSSIKMHFTVKNFWQPVAHFQNPLQLQTVTGFPVVVWHHW